MSKKIELRIISYQRTIPAWLMYVLDACADDVHATLVFKESYDAKPQRQWEKLFCAVDRCFSRILWKHRNAFSVKIFDGETWSLSTAEQHPNCDVTLNLTTDDISPRMASASRYGVWYFSTTGGVRGISYRAILADFASRLEKCYVAIIRQAESTSLELISADVRSSNVPIGGILCQRSAWTAADILTVALKKLSYKPELFTSSLSSLEHYPMERNDQLPMRNGNITSFTFCYCGTVISRAIAFLANRMFAVTRWHIAYTQLSQTVDKVNIVMGDFCAIPLPSGEFWGDPFLVTHQGTDYIFFERFIYRKKRGDIAYIKQQSSNQWSEPVTVLDTGFHLSYPFIFEDSGNIYMIPETRSAKQIRLYRAVAFPDIWELDSILMDDISTVDTTLYWHNDKYWLFSCVANIPDAENSSWLNLYYADSLRGVWTAHPANPIDCSLGHARPAGKLFEENGKLFRLGQNSYIYGRGITVMQVDQMDEEHYQEHPVRLIEPDWDADSRGVHTLNFSGNSAVIDILSKCKKNNRR